ncbi:unnamed protein product [Owenia fusiformis]|uniref:Uncharacterized protein n=1 Tax=Owenia fusiformis TaxID=6347 RepID=A0A8J1XIB4_OWEFU|nr:unnamed protein product [Owenia fusiformis]
MESEFVPASTCKNICIKEEISEPDTLYPGADKGSCQLQCTCTTAAYDNINNGAVLPSTEDGITFTCNHNEHCTCCSNPQFGVCGSSTCCNIKEEPVETNIEDSYTTIPDVQTPDEEINEMNNGENVTMNWKNGEIDDAVLVKQTNQRIKRKNTTTLNSEKIKVKIVKCTPKTHSNQDNTVTENAQIGAKKRAPYVVIKEKAKYGKLNNKSRNLKKNIGSTNEDEIENTILKTESAKTKINTVKTKAKSKKKKSDDLTDDLLNLSKKHSGTENVSKQVDKLQCEFCQKLLSTKLALKRHHERYHEATRKMYPCDACHRSFTRKDKLKYHLKNLCPYGQSRDPKNACEICKLSFYDARSVQRHMKNRHFLVASKDGFTCQKCDVTIESLDKFNCHFEPSFTQHATSRQLSNFHNKTCEVCQSTFDSMRDLQNHMPTHFKEGNYECKICDAKYSLLKNLLRHIRQIHKIQTENFVCAVCDKSFVRKDVLRKHMLSHTNAKEYVCKICKKTFNRRDCMMSHMKNIHAPESEKHQYKKEAKSCCDTCGSVFSTAFLLREHIMITHEGKAVECKLCGYQCLHRLTVYNHLKVKHGQMTSLGFVLYRLRKPGTKAPVETVCEFCNKRLCSRHSYMTHMRMLHPEKYEMVKKQSKIPKKNKAQLRDISVRNKQRVRKRGKSKRNKKVRRVKSPLNSSLKSKQNLDETDTNVANKDVGNIEANDKEKRTKLEPIMPVEPNEMMNISEKNMSNENTINEYENEDSKCISDNKTTDIATIMNSNPEDMALGETASIEPYDIQNTTPTQKDRTTNLSDKAKLCNIIGLKSKETTIEHGNIYFTFGNTSAIKTNESRDIPENETINGDTCLDTDDDVIISHETDFEDSESD